MKRLLIFATILIFVACETAHKTDYALLSGKAEHANTGTVSITGNTFEQNIPINPDGTFADTLRLPEQGFYTLSIGRERTSVYLKNGDNLVLTLDTNQFDETLKYSGIGSAENNYLAAKELNTESYTANQKALYTLNEEAFKAKMDSLNNSNAALLAKFVDTDEDFASYETKNLEYDRFALLNRYEGNHAHYTKDEDFKVSEDFLPEALKHLAFDDASAYSMSTSYKNMAFSKTMNDLFNTIGDDYLNASPEMLQGITTIKIPELKNDVVDYLGSFLVSPGNPNMVSVYEFFKANTTDEEVKAHLDEVYEKGKDLAKGRPSPQFKDYENHEGGTLSLSDLRGKYVYIDVWATWCGPCKREIPALKDIEKQFDGKNIVFVSTSIDVAKDHDTWFKMVDDLNLQGIQLFADHDWSSQFVTDYGIEGIPRFILVDPDGNIVSADAPRPSNPRLIELFNSLDI